MRLRISLELLQIGANFRSVLVSQVPVFLQSPCDDCVEFGGQCRIQGAGRNGVGMSNGINGQGPIVAGEGPLPGGQFIEHHAQREQVTPRVDLFPLRLLWRHVRSGAWNHTFLSERVVFNFNFDFSGFVFGSPTVRTLANPKSRIFTRPELTMKMFPGLISR